VNALKRCALAAPLFLAALAAHADDAPPPDVAWVKANAHPLTTVEAGHGFDDLAFLEKAVGDARVVGLGEATHGTREHFQMKHRLLEFLATKMGFNVFAIEANMPESYGVDRYVSGGEGDPAALVGGMYFWTWNTEEVLDMVKWMRAFNEREAAAKSGKHVRFAGFDMQMPEYSQKIVRRFVEKHDAEFLPELDADSKRIGAGAGRRGAFGVTNAFVPVSAVRGKKIRFSGYVRTEDVADGWAGLWLRVDTASEPNKLLDNMHDRGPSRTTDWTRCSVEFDVPDDAVCVVLGTLLVGTGRAWFDALEIEVDGKKNDSFLDDPSFETKELGPFPKEHAYAVVGGEIRAVEGVAKDGKRSLLMRSPATKAGEDADPEAAAKAVFDHLVAARTKYVASGAAPSDAEWAIQNARIVVQATHMQTSADSNAARDAAMAENVRWILDQDPNSKVVVWAHNMHVSRTTGWMGSHLGKALGAKYVNVGFMAGGGTYYAMGEESTDAPAPHVHRLQEPVEGSAELKFRRAGMPLAIVDLRAVDPDAPGTAWMSAGCKFGDIGAGRRDARFDDHVRLRDAFDLLIYVDQTTAAHQLKTPPASGPPND
jgi:erythromycin esterase-like protein